MPQAKEIALVPDDTLDARGLSCPIPFLLTRKRLAALPAGAVLLVLANDPRAADDMAAITERGDCELVGQSTGDGVHCFTLRKRKGSDPFEFEGV